MRKVFIVPCHPDKYHAVRDGLLSDGLDTPDRGFLPGDIVVVEETKPEGKKTGAVTVLDVREVEQTSKRWCRLKVTVCADSKVCR